MKRLLGIVTVLVSCMLLFAPVHGGATEHKTLADLDTPLQSLISKELGKENPSFQFHKEGSSYRTSFDGITALIGKSGFKIEKGKQTWSVALADVGGKAFNPGAILRPEKNRIERSDSAITEWYVNGPVGLEQGWTIYERPDGARPLALSFRTEGTLRASIDGEKKNIALKDAHETTQFTYGGVYALDADARSLPVRFEKSRQGFLLVVNDENARYPIVIDPFVQVAKLTASDGAAYDYLGLAVAISSDGSTIAAGAPDVSPGGITNVGAVYIFSKGTTWANGTQTAKLTASDGATLDYLGYAVSVSSDGSTVAAGAPGASPGGITGAGAVYIFLKGTAWADSTQTAKLSASDGDFGDALGSDVSISADGSTVAAGASYDSPGGTAAAGAAYVFLKGTAWADSTQVAKLTASDGAAGDYLGLYVAISGDGSTVAAGAPDAAFGATAGGGAVYVFLKGTAWADSTETAKLTASDGASGVLLGTSVTVSSDGSTIAAGAPFSPVGAIIPGAVYVFLKGTAWATGTETAKLTASDGVASDNLGTFVAISPDGSMIAGGAPDASPGGISGAGAVYIFSKGTAWANGTEAEKLIASDGAAYDSLGFAVAITADGRVVGGAPFASPGGTLAAGAVYVFPPLNGRRIVWRNTATGLNSFWYMDGATWTGSYDLTTTVADQNWNIVGVGDFNADGKPDLLWRNSATGQNSVWYMDGATWTGTYDLITTVADQNWKIVGVGDFNADTKPDILWRNSATGLNSVWYMNGAIWNGSYDLITTVADQNWKIVGVGDFNADTKPDILWRNSATGQNSVWYMDGATWTGSYDLITTVADQNWKIVGVGDFNADTKPDILWRNSATGLNSVWYMNGAIWNGSYDLITTVPDQNWKIVGVE